MHVLACLWRPTRHALAVYVRYGICVLYVIERGFVVVARTMYDMFACMLAYALCRYRCGAWIFAEMLINFCFGKLLHYPYDIFIGKVMPNFSGDDHKLF
jgi:hypothetical protein